MTAQHTPGPWVVTQDCGAHVIRGANIERHMHGTDFKWRDYVASTWGGENLANARLIAAAPEMLEALQALDAIGVLEPDLIGIGEEIERAVRLARAAIQKATKEQV